MRGWVEKRVVRGEKGRRERRKAGLDRAVRDREKGSWVGPKEKETGRENKERFLFEIKETSKII
jgi:hypothetical protein